MALIPGADELIKGARNPEIVADAARAILTQPGSAATGRFFIDEDVLREAGVHDFSHYALNTDMRPVPDLFLDS